MSKKLLILLLVISPALLAQTSKTGRITVGHYANGPGLPIPCNAADQWNTDDGHGAYLCITANTWQQIGGGGNNYQTIQTSGVSVTQEPKLNFVNVPCVDNPGNNSTDCTASYQTVQNNAVSLTQRPLLNFVPPLTATDNGANTRTDINCPSAVGVGGSHSSGCVPDPGASGTTTDYLGRDMLYHASGSASTVKPDPSTAVQYVAATCNGGGACTDANDGLTWGTAKLTVYNAACSLPTGNCGSQIAGAGTIFVGPSATFNPTSGDGLWLMGSTDPNYASPPAGWLKFPNTASLNVIGVPNAITGPNGHKPTVLVTFGAETDRVHPAVWLSDIVSGFYMSDFHFQYLGRAVVIGECSNGDRTGTCGTQSVILENVSAQINQIAGNGPCTDIASNVFWIWMRDGGCAGNAYVATGAPTSDNSAAILLDGSAGSGSGLVYVVDYQLAGGGIKVKQGSNGASLYARNVIEEGDFTHALPPVVWFTGWSQSVDSVLDNVQTADGGPGSLNAIQNDGDPTIFGGPTVLNSNGVTGPANIINQTEQTTTLATQSPLVQRQAGIFNDYLVGHSDIARRMLGLASVRFTSLVYANPVGWTGITIATPNQPDPFGGTLAEKIANNTSSQATATLGPNTPYTPTAGDWLVGGVWAQGLAQNGNSLVISATSFPVPTYSTTINNRGMQTGDGQWQFLSQISKVASGAATNINLQVKYTNTITPTLYGPVLYIIPAGTLSDSEVVEFANSMNSVDNNCAIGSICSVQTHPISADTFTERAPNSAPTGATGITQQYMDPTSNWPSFKPNGNTAYTIPGFTGSWTAGQCATATSTVNVFNLATCGGGGSGNVSNALLNSFAIYTGAGVTNQIGGVAGPTIPANVTQYLTYTPNGTVSGAPSVQLAGIPVRTFNGSPSDTVLATDRNGLVAETFAGNLALNVPTTLLTNGFAFKVASRSSLSNITIATTPAGPTCNGSSSCTMLQGQNALFTLDASGSNLLADIHDPPLIAGSGISLTRGDYGLTVSAPGAVGTTGSPAAGNLAKFSAAATITNGDLSGDCTTSGTLTITCQKVNGTTYPAGGALTTNTVPVVTGVAAVTYETVPNAALTNSSTTANGQTCTLGSTCNVNSGAATHGIALNEGNGNAISSIAALTVNQIPVGVASADPVAGNLSELSATLYGGTDTGTSTAYVACSTPAAAALHTGQVVSFTPANANSSNNPTLAWCGLTAKTIVSIGGAVLAFSPNHDITTSAIPLLLYDGTNFELQNPQTNSVGASVRWDQINAANANKNLNNGAFTTTFTQSSNIAWIWQNTTAATNATQQTPPTMALIGQYCTVASTCGSAADQWRFRPTFTSAVNPPSTLVIEHSGSSGTALVQMPNVADLGTLTVGTSVTAGASGTAGTYLAFPSSGNFTTTWGSAATASNTILGFATAPTTGDIVTCTTSSTTCTLTDSAILGTNVVTNSTGNAAAANQVIVSAGANKTVQAIDFPERYFIPAANCNNTTAGAGWSIGSGGTVTCRAGTNNLGGYITITDTSSTFAQFMLTIPFDWNTANNPYIRFFFSSATDTTNGHTVIPQVKVSCPTAGNGTVNDDHAFAAAHSSSTVTFGASAVANGFYNGSNVQFNSTDMTGCIAGGLMIVQVGRATDTATGNINFYGADVTFPRLLTVGAE